MDYNPINNSRSSHVVRGARVQAIKKRKYVSDTFGKKAKCYAFFFFAFFNSENELSPVRFDFFYLFFLQPRLNVYVLCDIQKQKH